MLNNLSKTISISANSTIGKGDTMDIVMYMNANINPNGDININQSIRNQTLYKEHLEIVDKDFLSFKDVVMECMKDI